MSYEFKIRLSEEELALLRDCVSNLGHTNPDAVSLQLKLQNAVKDSVIKTIKEGK